MKYLWLALATGWLTACGGPPGPLLVVEQLEVYAPLPGSSAGVAYLVLVNRTSRPQTFESVSSPHYSAVEIHETQIEDGIARMQPVDRLIVPAGGSLRRAAGGLHLMLMSPVGPPAVGDTIRLEFHHEDGSVLFADAPLRERGAGAPARRAH